MKQIKMKVQIFLGHLKQFQFKSFCKLQFVNDCINWQTIAVISFVSDELEKNLNQIEISN